MFLQVYWQITRANFTIINRTNTALPITQLAPNLLLSADFVCQADNHFTSHSPIPSEAAEKHLNSHVKVTRVLYIAWDRVDSTKRKSVGSFVFFKPTFLQRRPNTYMWMANSGLSALDPLIGAASKTAVSTSLASCWELKATLSHSTYTIHEYQTCRRLKEICKWPPEPHCCVKAIGNGRGVFEILWKRSGYRVAIDIILLIEKRRISILLTKHGESLATKAIQFSSNLKALLFS